MRKKWGILFSILCICLLFMGTDVPLQAAAGKTSVAVSAGTVNIGDALKVTAMAAGPSGEKTVATMTVSYDSAVFSFVDCSTTYGGGGGSVTATSDRFTVTLKAIAAGSSKISVAGSDGVIFDTNEELDSVEGSSTRVTVNNAASNSAEENKTTTSDSNNNQTNTSGANENKPGGSGGNENASNTGGGAGETDAPKLSADNSLKALSISPGTLSPEFTGKTVNYTATVANDVTRVAVTATVANEKAMVESVTGNENLAVGNNALKIVVKAENGVTATYTITVTRQAAEASSEKKEEEPETLPEEPAETTGETVTIGEKSYFISEGFLPEQIPSGFVEAAVSYHGKDYQGVHFDKGGFSMLYLTDGNEEAANAGYFVYNEAEDAFYPFVQLKHGDNFIIWKPVPAEYIAAENERQMDITVNDGETMSVRQIAGEETSDFSFFYAVNQDGTEGWYSYDALEKTYQRQHNTGAAAALTEGEPQEEEEDPALAYLEEEYSKLEDELKKEKAFSRTVIGVVVFVAVVLSVILINFILFKKGNSEEFDSYEEQKENHRKKTQRIKRKKPEPEETAVPEKSRKEEEVEKPQKTVRQKQSATEVKEEKDKQSIEIIDFNDL